MRHEFLDKPDYGMALVTFETAGESIVVESGAMVARDTGIEMKTNMRGGLASSLKRKVLGGESLFLNTFTATAPGQKLYLAPAPEGDMQVFNLEPGREIIMQSGSYVASEPSVTVDTKWGGFKGFLSGEGLFFLRCYGDGELFFNTYGGLHQIELDGSDRYVVDTSHIVAFTEGLDFKINKIGGMKSLFFSGEGLVCDFYGEGTLWVQTRNPGSLASFLNPFRPQKSNNN